MFRKFKKFDMLWCEFESDILYFLAYSVCKFRHYDFIKEKKHQYLT